VVYDEQAAAHDAGHETGAACRYGVPTTWRGVLRQAETWKGGFLEGGVGEKGVGDGEKE